MHFAPDDEPPTGHSAFRAAVVRLTPYRGRLVGDHRCLKHIPRLVATRNSCDGVPLPKGECVCPRPCLPQRYFARHRKALSPPQVEGTQLNRPDNCLGHPESFMPSLGDWRVPLIALLFLTRNAREAAAIQRFDGALDLDGGPDDRTQ